MSLHEKMLIASLVLSLPCAAMAQTTDASEGAAAMAQNSGRGAVHLSVDGRLGDILDHPAFAGFAKRILPWDDRAQDPAMPLTDMSALLPYHSKVNIETVVAGLNRMIDDATAGQTVFYEIYSKSEREADPTKSNTGLFFYRGQPGAPFAVIAPGGGFVYVGSVHEGFPYAQEISATGLNAFVLKYRAGHGGDVASQDMAVAVSWVFKNAEALGVSTEGYSLWGSSAGARMAAYIGSHGPAAFGGDDLAKPAAVIMAYTGHSDVSSEEPPTFIVVGEHDGIASPASMEARIADLRAMGSKVEYHLIPGIGHGFGNGRGTVAEGWVADAIRFWQQQL